MSTTYARDLLTFTQAEIDAAVESGQAKYFATTKGPFYVLKRPEGGSIKVASTQIIKEVPAEVRVASPMDGYEAKEHYDLEDTGPGGVVYENALRIAQEYLAAIEDADTDPLVIVRSILDDEEGEYTNSLNETIYDVRYHAQRNQAQSIEDRNAAEDALLAKFGV